MATDPAAPPAAKRRPARFERFGRRWSDPWAWLQDRDDPEVRRHLEAENAWTRRRLGRWSAIRDAVRGELKARIAPESATPPLRHGPFFYYSRYRRGEEYAITCRRPTDRRGRMGGPEQVLLDGNRLAREVHGGKEGGYFRIGLFEPSPAHRLIAWSFDQSGNRVHEIRFLDTESGRPLDDVIPASAASLVWTRSFASVLYVVPEPDTLRWYRVMHHQLGSPAASDRVVYEEEDETFNVAVGTSRSRRFLFLHSLQTDQAEVWSIPAADPDTPPRRLIRRSPRHEFEVDHFRDRFYVRTNRDAPDFRLCEAPGEDPGREESWRDVVPARPGVVLEHFELFDRRLALFERRGGRQELRLQDWDTGASRRVTLPGPVRALDPEDNPEPEAGSVRIVVSTPNLPATTLAVPLAGGRTRTLKREEVPGFPGTGTYRIRRLLARAADGARIPISLAHHRDHPPGPDRPLLLYGYGAYGIPMDPGFQSARLSLLDRGFVTATAHIRGGGELGRAWYEGGRQAEKQNTFTDFIASARHLRRRRSCDPERMFAMGGSAGGLLMGAVMNREPQLFRGIVAVVPFVDCLNTMLDPDLPLTTGEYDEWGNPNEPEAFARIAGYAPYEQVRRAPYPHLLATAGLHDSQVGFWEPAKWIQRLRARTTAPERLILLRINLGAGHAGRSGRYQSLEETAVLYCFLIALATETP